MDAPHAACFESVKWCRVENISPLLQIGVQRSASAERRYALKTVLSCAPQQHQGYLPAIFRARPILNELLWSYFLGEAYLLELVVPCAFVIVALYI